MVAVLSLLTVGNGWATEYVWDCGSTAPTSGSDANITAVAITQDSGSGTLTGGGAQSLVGGEITFASLQVDAADTYTPTVAGGSLTSATSGGIVATIQLGAGDVAIVGYRGNATDGFAFVTWVPLDAGTVLYFTDSGFFSDGTMRATEDRMSWTAPAGGVNAGMVITVSCTAGNATASIGACVGTLAGLAAGGDQIFVGKDAPFPKNNDTSMPGSTYAGTLLYGFSYKNDWVETATGTDKSALPAALSGLYQNHAVTPAGENGQYVGVRADEATFAAYKALVHSYGQWAFEDGGATVLNPAAFSLPFDAPTAFLGVGVGPSRIQALWSEVSGATGYRIDVSLDPSFTEPAMLPGSHAAHNGTLGQAGWTETDLEQGAVSGDNYLVIRASTAVLISPTMDFAASTAQTLNFRMRTFGGVDEPLNTITVSISDNNGGSWTVLGIRVPLNATMVAAAPFDVSGHSGDQVRIKLETLGANGTVGVGVDDVEVTTMASGTMPSFVTGYENRAVGNVTDVEVTGLEPETTYYYRVRAENPPQLSGHSNVESATTLSATTVFMFK